MDPNDNSSKENWIPPNVQNHESSKESANRGSPGRMKRPVAASGRPRPPLPQKPPVAKKPNVLPGSPCLSKTETPCTAPNSTCTHSSEILHTHLSNSVPSFNTSADKSDETSPNNNIKTDCSELTNNVTVKDRTKTLGLYAAGKSLFYIDQTFEHAPSPKTNSSSSVHTDSIACTHAPVSKQSSTKSGKLRLPLIGFRKPGKSSYEINGNKNKIEKQTSKWYTEFAGDVAAKNNDILSSTNEASVVGDSCEPPVQRISPYNDANIESKPNVLLVSTTFSESAKKSEPPKSPVPKPAPRKVLHQPEDDTSPTSYPHKVPPQPVPRKRRSIVPKSPNDDFDNSMSVERECLSSEDCVNVKELHVSGSEGNERKSKLDQTECVVENIENETKLAGASDKPKFDDSDTALSSTIVENKNDVDSQDGPDASPETNSEICANFDSSVNNKNTTETLDGVVESPFNSTNPHPNMDHSSEQGNDVGVADTSALFNTPPPVPKKTNKKDSCSNFVHVSPESNEQSQSDLSNKPPQSDVLESEIELVGHDSSPQLDSVAQLPDTCDMLKEIEDLLNQTLGDVGNFSNDFLKDSSDKSFEDSNGVVTSSTKSVLCGRPKSESFSSLMPSRPPRPKRDASKMFKNLSLDLQDGQHSDTSSCDSANESLKKPCPPKPKRNLPPRVNRSQSDVSGMKSLIDQLESSFNDSKPAIPPRVESFAFGDKPPPLPPRNNSRSNSLDLSAVRQGLLTEDSKTETSKAAPFAKPVRRVIKRPSRKAPPPPPHPPAKKPDPSKLSASVCVTDKGLESEEQVSYRKLNPEVVVMSVRPSSGNSVDHDYHEIPESEMNNEPISTVSVKEITPPPELPPRIIVSSRSSSQVILPNESDSGSVKSDAVSFSKQDTDDSSSICSSHSSASPSKSVDTARPLMSESPLLSTRERPLSSLSLQSTNSDCGSFENVNRMNDLSSGSDSENEDDEEKQLTKKAKKVLYIAKEIMESEMVFVDVLKLLNIDFRVAVSDAVENNDRPPIPSETLNKILDYLPQLQSINEDLLKDIKDRIEHWDECKKIADVFVKKGPFLKLYSSYIRNFENATTLLDESCKKYPSFAGCVKGFEKSPRCANLALKHYMLKPIQRIPQYKLLLQDYLKNLSTDSPDYNNTITALNIVSEVADHANESMRHGDEVHMMMEIQHSLIGQFEVIQPGRSLLKKGELMKLSRKEKQPRMFFLFTDVLLYTTPTATGYRLNNILPLIGMKVVATDKPTTDEYGNEFSILSVQRSFTISASTPKERLDWMTALSDAIKQMTHKRDTFHSKEKGAQTFLLDKDFVLGHKAPLWVPDRRVTMCMLCLGEFTITWRRHHCRACGRIVCGYCSENKAPLRYLKYRPDRVCDECYEKLKNEIEEKEDSGQKTEILTYNTSNGASADGYAAKVSLNTIKERFQKLRWSGRARKKYAPPRAAVLKEVKANDEGSSMSGYLRMFRNKKWKRFWFVVKDNVLYAYKASEDMAAIESHPLLGFEVTRITEWFEGAEPDLVFQLTHQNTAPLIFRTDSATATTKWVNIMREASVCNMK